MADGVSGSSISQMKLSDTGYLGLWFWMNSVRGHSCCLSSLVPAVLLACHKIPHIPFLNLLSYSRLLLKRILVIITLDDFSTTNHYLLRTMLVMGCVTGLSPAVFVILGCELMLEL